VNPDMDIVYLKSEFLNVKGFFYDLYTGNARSNANKIYNADDKKLDVLIKALHLICNGHIHLRKEDFSIIKKSKRLNFLKFNFERKDSYVGLLTGSRDDKIKVLRKMSALYPTLLYSFFNLI